MPTKVPIVFSGPKPEEPFLTEEMLKMLHGVRVNDEWYTLQDPWIFFGPENAMTHIGAMVTTPMGGLPQGAFMVVSIQETPAEIIVRHERGESLPIETVHDHPFEMFFE